MAPDAVVRFVERTGEMRSGIGEREALAAADVMQRVNGISGARVCLHRDEMHGIDTLRRLEQNAVPIAAAGTTSSSHAT